MKRIVFARILASLAAILTVSAPAKVLNFDFSESVVGKPPLGFKSLVSGPGEPAKWEVVDEMVPPILAPLEPNAPRNNTDRAVLSVHSYSMEDNNVPIFLYTNEIFSDFTLTTRFKIGGGVVEPSAGVVFRAQDQSNYYALRASTEGNLLWYRVVNGRGYENLGIGVKLPMEKNVWRELKVECIGSQIRCYLDGKLAIPPARPGAPTNELAINDTTFARGMVGYWSKADSKCYFVDGSVQYTPRVPYLQIVIDNIAKKYTHVVGLDLYATTKNAKLPVVIGSMDEHDMGAVGTKTEADVIERGSVYYEKDEHDVAITLPLRDRNGDISGALKIKMKTFRGETQATAVSRATIVKKAVEEQVETLQDING